MSRLGKFKSLELINLNDKKIKFNYKNSIFNKLTLDPGTKQLASHCSFERVDDTVIYLSMPEEKLNLFNGKHRQELQEQPIFDGLAGPLWDGDRVRYETWDVFERLSK